ncbi:LamB/YcsF family protein [Cohnella luojiensis]|uniref:5-oxoprolinase subunit PxpA n=1 Tax=Cohnella luojiensis TaxID=652876 RepID=A0A4Y8M4Y2_9BACL|nr:5-oxoprolinase subunit PxpA [Cohnella luojiensis]TFE28111.1 5-oxoprolinase subunit PxpA [Cohnella luojiensis]
MTTIDLNADMGEGFGPYHWGADEILLEYVSSANIACGFHAGDPHTMRIAVESCLNRNVAIGAHPGLPDRLGFGRREIAVTPEEASDFVIYQVGALQAFVQATGGTLRHVKLHGALYHMAAKDERLSSSIVSAIQRLNPELMLYGPPGSQLQYAASAKGVRYVAEGFADRAYLPDGSLVERHMPGAVIEQPEMAARQAITLTDEGRFQSLCLHGDTPKAAEHAKHIAQRLKAAGISIQSP